MEDVIIKEGIHYIGNPCKNCRRRIRYVKSGNCVLCRSNRRKQRYQNNRDRELEQMKKWYQNNKERKLEYNKLFYDNLRDTNKKSGIYFEGNPCANCNNCLRYVSTGVCILCQSDRGKQWKNNNPDKIKANYQNRRARKQNAEGDFTDQEWIDLCNQYGNKCLSCGEEKPLQADHIVPLAKGGTNYIWNIQPLCGSCNGHKFTKIVDYRPKEDIPQEYMEFLVNMQDNQ